jgi:hypothetical protein
LITPPLPSSSNHKIVVTNTKVCAVKWYLIWNIKKMIAINNYHHYHIY